MWQISYPPVNGASQGNYFLPKSKKLAVLEAKTGLQKQLWQATVQTFLWFLLFGPQPRPCRPVFGQINFFDNIHFDKDVPNLFSPFCSAGPEIIGVKVCRRQTNSLTPYTGICGFILSTKFATSLLASLAGG